MSRVFWFLLTMFHSLSLAHAIPSVTETPPIGKRLLARAITTEYSTCGYAKGDPDKPRTAEPGHKCLLNPKNKLFAYCDVNADLEHCGMVGRCFDQHDCKKGCGKMTQSELLAVSCEKKEYCSLAVLTIQKSHTYTNIECGARAATEYYQITPNATEGATIDGTTTATMKLTRTVSVFSTQPTAETAKGVSGAVGASTESDTSAETTSEATPEASEGSSEDSSSGSPTNTGAIIGGVIGGLVVVCSTALGSLYLLRRNRSQGTKPETTEQGTPPQEPLQTWAHRGPKQLAGWGPQEMQGSTQFGRDNAVELPG
ncbi:uncharacterized protein NECHADRAFT_81267 [Fusarium vanettenii 77-13-4]|uniref:Uncharacterized protein n=1 Tax=Fusarium vanettenii (strain ATCC MYA-4622 / CBS 123669 / FGSC 9596 / NRRL 45880 / 77-13-4) TaxID=660122 RepID=C7ZHJ6_FUSV7|nr:uncharacterized protein NECHADRAFT_81267 [Fusarium vanettenii 77-13-4]EEU36479.1 hypothetical protein NECHADRAFT_81267 [Fusarium vanettenii 77-13-4]